jgi:hypothetical protein
MLWLQSIRPTGRCGCFDSPLNSREPFPTAATGGSISAVGPLAYARGTARAAPPAPARPLRTAVCPLPTFWYGRRLHLRLTPSREWTTLGAYKEG